jgi:CheY-like chemotaxis protein
MARPQPLVLVIDDEEEVRDGLERLLRGWGYRVAACPDGAEALEFLHRGARPDLILLDLTMPRLDGYEFRRRQRADAELRHIPVVVLTALPEPRVEDLEVERVLTKPYDVEVLRAEVARLTRPGPVSPRDAG